MEVLIVDACPVFREGLKTIVSRMMHEARVVAETDNYRAARGQINPDFDLLILDGELEALSLVIEVRSHRRRNRPPYFLVLTAHRDVHHAVQFLNAGAEGYLHKSAPIETMIEAIRRVGRGRKFVAAEITDRILADFGNTDKPEPLSHREYEVLSLMASGLQVGEIADRLALSPKTISTYRVRLLEKLRLRNNGQLMRYAFQQGIMD